MLNESILSQLREMKLDGMVSEVTNQFDDPAKYAHLSFDERFRLLVSAEWSRRKTNRINRYITRAGFSAPSATIDGIEYLPRPLRQEVCRRDERQQNPFVAHRAVFSHYARTL